MSARRISAAADAPVSSIYHHFGSLEHLFEASQQASLERAREWCGDWLAQLAGVPARVDALPGLFAEIVDEWSNGQRTLAFAWRECQMMAESSALLQPLVAQWDVLWEGFWIDVGARLGLGGSARLVQRVFDNESFLHLIRWRRVVDRPALDEIAAALGAWVARKPVPPTPWRDFARSEAYHAMPELPERDGTARQIVEAAAALIDDSGVATLTHRAVAERAGLTLGTVSHKFGTKTALLEAAFEGLYAANLNRLQGGPATLTTGTREGMRATMADLVGRARIRGSDELFLAVARDPSLSQFGLQLRYLRGRTALGTLQTLVGDSRKVSHVEAALFSSFTTAQIRRYGGASGGNAVEMVGGEIDALIALVAPD